MSLALMTHEVVLVINFFDQVWEKACKVLGSFA